MSAGDSQIGRRRVIIFCDGQIVPPNDGFSGHLAGRIRIHKEVGTELSLLVTDRGWNDPIRLDSLDVPVDLVSPDEYYGAGPKVEAVISRRRPDVVVIPNARVVLSAVTSSIARYRIIYEVHELVSELAVQLQEAGRAEVERTLELAAARCADLVVTFTEHDRRRFLQAGLEEDRVAARPCVASFSHVFERASTDPRRLVFLGNGFYEPNRRAIAFLGQELLPTLPSDALLTIIGTQPPLPTLEGDDRIRIVGPVENLAAALQSSAVGLCPVWHGTGIRIKVFDYGAAGLVTVAAKPGVQGVPATPGIIAVETREQFVQTVLRLIANPSEFAQRQKAALDVFRREAGVEVERALLGRTLGRPVIRATTRRAIAGSPDIEASLSRFPQPRWLEETLGSRRFS